MRVYININVADVLAEESFKAERVSQGLYNEIVDVIENGELMDKVRFADGYTGWIRKQFISEYTEFAGAKFIINDDVTPGFERPDGSSKRLTLIPYGCLVFGEPTGDFVRIQSQRYGQMFLPRHELLDETEYLSSQKISGESLKNEAEKFMGTPYLWGGRSFFGFDCSGFVKALAQRFGVTIPRDTKEQIKCGKETARDDILAGDLLFFPHHVGIAIRRDLIIHCSSSNGGVAYNSLDPADPCYSESYDKSFITARRIFP